MKKTEALHKLWVEAKRGEDRARSKQEQLMRQLEAGALLVSTKRRVMARIAGHWGRRMLRRQSGWQER